MKRKPDTLAHITKQVEGKLVSHVEQPGARRLEIHFTDGSILAVDRQHGGLVAALTPSPDNPRRDSVRDVSQPTGRQREYLEFIARYRARFGVSPAEADIARHFLVSAPSVNQMVQTLERRGFITRRRGAARSIAILDHVNPSIGTTT